MYSSTQPGRSYFPSFVQNRNPYTPHQVRPQTSKGSMPHVNQGGPLNRSYNKYPNQPYPYAPPRNNNPSHSRVSMSNSQASQLTNLVNQPDIFPEDLIFLLRNQEKNINNVKQKVEREKARVENDFAVFRAEIDHVLEDVKISVQAELDLVYKAYITKYAELKGEVQELRLLRKEVLMNTQNGLNYGPNHISVSNKDLINQIQVDAQHMRNFRVYGYLGQLQRQKLEPISQIANQLIIVGAAECPFYRHKELTSKFKQVKGNFASIIKEVFDALDQYVVTPESLIDKERNQFQNTKTVLRELDLADATRLKPFDVHYPSNSYVQDKTRDLKASKEIKKSKNISVGPNQQGCVTRWCQDVRLNRLQRVQTDHQDSILCIHFVGDRYVATGSKDTTVNVYSLDGRKIRTLKGHQAAICCLSFVRGPSGDLLASGSDNGCGSVVLWDIKNWQMVSKIQAHEAAVTSIVDLQDGKHIATGSYDKKINIFSMSRNQRVISLNNRTSVTGMVMNSDRSRLVAAGLDKSISIWTISRKNGVVQDILNEKIISNEELVCQLQPSLLRPEVVFCACRDGTLRVLNISSGLIERSFTVNANSLIELVAIEREMNVQSPILISCSCKDSALVLTKMDSGLSSLIKMPGGLGIDYGCGIGPKVVLSEVREGLVAVVNQRKDNREFSLFQLELK